MKFKFLLMIVCLGLFPVLGHSTEVTRVSWLSVSEEVGNNLKEGLVLYEAGNLSGAKSKVTDAYFEIFEGKGMESAVSLQMSQDKKTELESMFSGVRGAITEKAPSADIRIRIDLLTTALQEVASKMDMKAGDKKNKPSLQLFIDSFIIIVREGFEAILIISALIAYLAKTGHGDKKKILYMGAVLALPASVVTAVVLNELFSAAGPAREGLEGITMLFAAAVLFYVSYWLISKAEVGRWQKFIKNKMEAALSGRSVFALASAAFLAVYREGAETIIFYQALHSSAGEGGTHIVIYGFAAGTATLSLIYLAVNYMSLKVPLGPFFAGTGSLLYYMAFSFAGKGVLELQEAGWIPSTSVNLPTIPFFGIFPTIEGLILQGLLFIAALGAGIYAISASYRDRSLMSQTEIRK